MTDEPTTGTTIAPRPSVQVLAGPQILAQQAEERQRDQAIVERLMDVASRRSETLGKLAGALAKAQGAMTNAQRDSANPHFKSRFASLASVRDACGPHLSENEIAYVQTVRAFGRIAMITTGFYHSSGEFMEETLTLSASDDRPQTVGSAITYGRRYALAAMAGIAPYDDDGEEASRTLPQGIRNDTANTPLQRAVGRTQPPADELSEGAEAGQKSAGDGPRMPGTPAPATPSSPVGTAPSAAPKARPVMGAAGAPPPPGRPPMRAPGSTALQDPPASTDK